ncbi:MAG: hypothetical protein M1822_005004 [Bathelium mastoideum]|nr:MAG: hypothetical protein M1822_005004 [Bathelium mastoideum]
MASKSILKNPSARDATAQAHTAREQRNRDIAIHHATLIQQQKDAELQILEAIEELIDYPTSPDADPANPLPADVARFASLVVPFQPSDYDSLIEERHCADLCGYSLCPRKPTKQNGKAKMRIIGGSGSDQGPRFVPSKQLEMWCSEPCAKRALYVKAQLNEEPAWLRRASRVVHIEILYDKPAQTFTAALPERLKTSAADDAIEQSMLNLALERGEQSSSVRSKGLINDEVLENTVTRPAVAPSPSAEIENHKRVEGYNP